MLPFASYEIEKWHHHKVAGRVTCGGGIIGKIIIIGQCSCHSFETWLARQVVWDVADPELESNWVDEKIGKAMIRYDPADPAKPGCNLLTFIIFLTKTMSF